MIVLQLRWAGHRGPDAIGQHKLTFSMDESIDSSFNPMQMKQGAQFVVMMIPVEEIKGDNFEQETIEDAKERFRKHMFAIISDIAGLSGDSVEEIKERFKGQLRKLGLIKESTKELDLEGLSKAINILKEKRNEYN